MFVQELLAGIGTGLAGGFSSGLLGVSPGGGLVVFSVLLLGAEQHVAQGVSLVAQIPPTSLAGIKRYWEQGSRSPLRWLIVLALGFVGGGIVGAFAADPVSSSTLQWAYVAYLVLLDGMLILRREHKAQEHAPLSALVDLHWAALLAVGLFAGLSSWASAAASQLSLGSARYCAFLNTRRRWSALSSLSSRLRSHLPGSTGNRDGRRHGRSWPASLSDSLRELISERAWPIESTTRHFAPR
jgi:uncharacterized membrane protein YfcA